MSSLLCIGANHGGTDVSGLFYSQGLIWLGWEDYEARDLINILKRAPVGTLVAIKSWQPTAGLTIKALGIMKSDNLRVLSTNGRTVAREVRWIHNRHHIFERIHDKMDNMRNGSLYYEPNERLIADIVSMIP